MKFNKRITPLTTILLLSGFCAVVIGIGAWYWTSTPITTTITVSGNIFAKANIDPRELWFAGLQVPYASLVEITTLISGSEVGLDEYTDYAFIIVDSTNAEELHIKVTATKPAGMSATAEVYIVAYADGSWWGDPLSLGSIALDGSQSIQLISDSEPLYLVEKFAEKVRLAIVGFNIGQGSLGIGTHTFSVVLELGDAPEP